jgi:mono/diheme cytochrome c family protein
MALLNIGLVIFGAIYYFLPELTGRELWSDAMAKWHVWLTFVLGNLNSALWIWQGLEGAPRRFSVLPEPWDELNTLAVPIVLALGAAQILFVWNLTQTLRGAERRTSPRRWTDAAAEAALVLTVLFLVGLGSVVGFVVGRETAPEPAASAPATTAAGAADAAALAVFADAGCGSCHAFGPAGSSGTVGPSLDATSLDAAAVAQVVRNGRNAMPAFGDQLSDQQIARLAQLVARSG